MTSLALENKLLHSGSKKFSISGVNSNQWSVLFKLFFKSNSQFKRNIFLFSDESEAEKFYNFISSSVPTEFYPDIGSNIYSSMVPSEFNLTKRLSILSKLVNDKPEEVSIITTYSAINLYTPDQSYFTNNCFTLAVDDIITYDELSTMLVTAGYQRTPSIVEPGAFSIKGEIFDIFPFTGDPVRLFFFDELIESIFPVKPDSLITIKENPLSSVKIQKTQYSLLNKEFVHNFRSNLPRPSLIDREKFSYRELILKKLSSYNFFEDYPLFLSYFFKQPLTLLDYVPDFNIQIFDEFSSLDAFSHFKSDLNDNFSSFKQHNNEIIKPSPSEIYNINQTLPDNLISINNVNITTSFNDNLDEISIKTTSLRTLLKSPQQTNKEELFKLLCQMIEIKIKENIKIYIFYTHKNSKEEILYLLETFFENTTLISHIIFQHDYLHEGFFYNHEKILFVSENDFFEKKVKKAKAKRATTTEDLFADQLATLQINDYVIHKDFGVGQYKGMESLELSGSTSDYIVISYQDNDKVYVPIYKLHLLQKHSSKDAKVSIANLKSKKFEQAKQKAKNAVKVLAFDLLELQAKRKLKKGFAFSEPDHIFNEFSLSFRFDETPDQRAAIENVIGDMVSERPMDRLVCGDVGFGKTEVAMRAAFKAVLDNKQVGILVPTTVLALQHYNSFIERFKKFPIHIEFISRFKTAKQVKEILQKLTEGKVDILIGTHKLLSEKVKFKDLGLLVIDEEQRFGVAHKEKLKLLRETVDTLTLTATPIPRTLQLSFLGIKDLSLIKTPPPSRQTIKSYLIKEDNHTLKLAIQKELSRGGQVFIVHNKVLDIEIYTSKIRELAPQARIIFAHGQLPEKELEKRISDFYNYKYDILISTTIIESGIDIPKANTMIIDRADTFGLSQLHQLRGRIGRSDKKAYAYFIIPTHKKISDVASKRLKALQTYVELGSGLALATSDLEIRGSGDILGPEQSGHLGTIGLELYMELLQECIHELKGETHIVRKTLEIQTPFNAFIPKLFIEDTSLRLKYYKRISNCRCVDTLETVRYEITDQYGHLPVELRNLFTIINSRILLSSLALNSIKVKQSSIYLFFDQAEVNSNNDLRDKIIDFFAQRPKIYKINPDYSIICSFKDKISTETLLEFATNLNKKFN